MKLIEIRHDDCEAWAHVQEKNVPLVSLFSFRLVDGKPWARLYDAHDSEVTLQFLIDHPNISNGCNGRN